VLAAHAILTARAARPGGLIAWRAPFGTRSEGAVFGHETLDMLVQRVIPAVVAGAVFGEGSPFAVG